MSLFPNRKAPAPNPISRSVLILVTLILNWLGPKISVSSSNQIDRPQPTDHLKPAELVSVEVSPTEILLAEPTVLSVRVHAKKPGTYRLPDKLDLSPFTELARSQDMETYQGKNVELFKIKIASYEDLGDLIIPAFRLEQETPSDGRPKSILVPPLKIKVLSVLEGIPEPRPRDVAGPVEVHVPDYRVFVFSGLGLFWLLMALWLRNKVFQLPKLKCPEMRYEVVDARELALRKLRQLIQDDLLGYARFQEYYIRISETVREYVGNHMGFFALDLTTRELIDELKKHHTSALEHDLLQKILEDADLVKFAKIQPSEEMSSKSIQGAFRLIEQANFSNPGTESI